MFCAIYDWQWYGVLERGYPEILPSCWSCGMGCAQFFGYHNFEKHPCNQPTWLQCAHILQQSNAAMENLPIYRLCSMSFHGFPGFSHYDLYILSAGNIQLATFAVCQTIMIRNRCDDLSHGWITPVKVSRLIKICTLTLYLQNHPIFPGT